MPITDDPLSISTQCRYSNLFFIQHEKYTVYAYISLPIIMMSMAWSYRCNVGILTYLLFKHENTCLSVYLFWGIMTNFKKPRSYVKLSSSKNSYDTSSKLLLSSKYLFLSFQARSCAFRLSVYTHILVLYLYRFV